MPGAGGMYLPIVLKICPINPSGVQLASPILPPLADAHKLRRRPLLVRCEHRRMWKAPRRSFRRRTADLQRRPPERRFRAARRGPALLRAQQGADIVGRHHQGEAACGRKRGVAVAGGNIQHPLIAAQVDGFAQALSDDLQVRFRRARNRLSSRQHVAWILPAAKSVADAMVWIFMFTSSARR